MFDLKILKPLIEKYSTSIPRYTSYPTAVEFHQGITNEKWEHATQLESKDNQRDIALYLHIPFCHSLCYYCACYKKIEQDYSKVPPYLDAVIREADKYSSFLNPQSRIRQFHWGGGTPNFLTPEDTSKLFRSILKHLPPLSPDADISIEVDPRTVSEEHIRTYKDLGFNRLSAGVQDFDPKVQTSINRIQSYEQTLSTCQHARELGFKGINLDLIYGLPEQTISSFSSTIEKVLTLKPERIALYGYAHVTWKKKVQKTLQRFELPSPEERIQLFLMALNMLTDAGYIYIGMDHFALPDDSLVKAMHSGDLNRNFMGYTTHKDANVIGLGVSSISQTSNMLAQNTTDLEEYLANDPFHIARGVERTLEDRLRGEVIESLLCSGALKYEAFNKTWGIDFQEKFKDELSLLKLYEADNLLQITSLGIKITDLGRLFMRNIASTFDTFLEKHQSVKEEKFSKSI